MFDLSGKRALITGASGGGALPAKVGTGFAFRQRDHENNNAALFGVCFYV